jgi:uncharacterized protein (DUF2147 family)
MNQLTRTIAAFALAAVSALPAVAGNIPSPAGEWMTTTGESRYRIEMCGDGTEICATLTWLREDARTPENLAYLNKMVVKGKQSTPAMWKGQVVYEGETYDGRLTMINSHTIRLAGCKGPACESMMFTRI